jgi:hypothetical protein
MIGNFYGILSEMHFFEHSEKYNCLGNGIATDELYYQPFSHMARLF